MKKLCFILALLFFAFYLRAEAILEFDFRLLMQDSYHVSMNIEVSNTGDSAWNQEFNDSEVFFFTVDGIPQHGMVLPIVLPLVVQPGESYSEDLYNHSFLENGNHVFQAYIAIQNGAGEYYPVGDPLNVEIRDGATINLGEDYVPNRIPIDFWWRTSIYECLLTASDMYHKTGYLDKITLYYSFADQSFMQQNISFALALVNENDLANGWIVPGAFTYQRDTLLDFSISVNQIDITIPNGFYLDGSSNLVLRIFRPIHGSYQVGNEKFDTYLAGDARARKVTSDSYTWGLFSPPTAAVNQLSNILPRMTLHTESGPVEIGEQLAPDVHQNLNVYPNPARTSTQIVYSIAKDADVSFTIYNSRGQMVRRMEVGNKAVGKYTALWDGMDESGRSVSTGVYYIRMQAGAESNSRKVLLMK